MDCLTATTSTEELKDYISELKPGFWGNLLYHCLPIRKAVVQKNIDIAFQDELSEDEKTVLVKSIYKHFMLVVADTLTYRFRSKSFFQNKVHIDGEEAVRKILTNKTASIVFTGHLGSIEVGASGWLEKVPELKNNISITRKAIKSKFLQKFLFQSSENRGLKVIQKNRQAAKHILNLLKNTDEKLIFIIDQHTSIRKRGLAVEFFSQKAGTNASIAKLIKKTSVPAIPVAIHRTIDGEHIVSVYDPLDWIEDKDPETELYLNLRQYNQCLENMIRMHPDQWFWFHKRWKL